MKDTVRERHPVMFFMGLAIYSCIASYCLYLGVSGLIQFHQENVRQ